MGITIDKLLKKPLLHTHSSNDVILPRTAIFNSDYTVLTTDYIVAYTGNSDDMFITLPACASVPVGKVYIFKVEYSDLGGFIIYVRPNGSEKIDGANEVQLNTSFESLQIYSNGSNWFSF